MGARGAIQSLDALRARIREIEGGRGRRDPRRIHSGVPALDRLIGGLPQPGLLEVQGRPGTGRVRLALAVAAQVMKRGHPVAWVDPLRRIHPPGLAALGLDLDRLLVVQPAADREAWAVEQVLRSGGFPLVVVADPGTSRRAGQQWALAAEAGGCTLLALTERPARWLPAEVRLRVGRQGVAVQRDRGAPPGACGPLPPWPGHAAPWP